MVVGLLREGEDVALGGVGKVQFGMVQNGKRVFVLKGQGKGRVGKGREGKGIQSTLLLSVLS